MSFSVFDLMAKITLDSSEYDKGLDKSESKSKSFGDKLQTGLKGAAKAGAAAITGITAATAAVSTAFVKGAGNVAAYGDNIDKMSQKMGMSATAYQEWDAIMQHSGTSIDALKPSMKTLATQAQKNAAEFQKLGISQEEVANLSREDLFAKVISGLQDMEEGTERTAITSKLLGRGATELGALLNTSAEDTQKMRDEVHKLGGVMSEDAVKAAAAYQDQLQDMQTAFSGLSRNMMGEFLPSVTDVMKGLTAIFSGDSEGGIASITNGVKSIADGINEALPTIIETGSNILVALSSAITDNLPTVIPAIVTGILTVVTGIATQMPTLLKGIIDGILNSAPAFVDAGMQLFTMLGDGVKKAVDYVKANGETILKKVLDTITAKLPAFLDNGVKLITNLANGLFNALPTVISKAGQIMSKLIAFIISNAPTILSKGMELIVNLAQGLLKALPNIISSITQITTGLIRQLIAAIPTIIETGFKLIGQLAAGLIKALPNIIKSAGELIKGMINVWRSYDWLTVGKNVITGIINGLKAMSSAVVNAMIDIAKSAMNAIKNFFGIKSPSKKMRDEVGKNIVLGMIQGVNDEKKNAKKSAEELSALYVSTAKNKLKALQAQNKLSLEEEWAYWLEVREATKKGSKAYNDATVEIGKVKDKIAKENEKIAKEQEKFKKNIDKTTTTYIDKVTKITENLDKEVEKLREAYNEAVAKRRDEILGQLGLFDEFKADEAVDKTSLTENLRAQVEALDKWNETLKALEGRIGDTSLYDELQKMGVKSLGTLTNLNSMSDEELQAYMDLYDEKTRIAQERAEREHEDLKATTDEQINDLITTADKQIKTLEKQYKKDIKELGLNANKEFNKAGKNSIKGMRAGMDSEMDKLETHMMARARELAEAVRKALEIESPSKVFARDVGRWIPLGIEKGFEQAMPEAESGILSGVDDLKESINGALSTSYSVGGTVQGLSITDILYGIYEAIMDANIEQAMTNALDNTHFDINDREFARLVKAV